MLKISLCQKIDDKTAHMITFLSNVITWLKKGSYWLHIHVLVMDAIGIMMTMNVQNLMKLTHKFIKHDQHLNHKLELETWNSKIACRHWVLWWVHKLGNMTIKRSHTRITYRKIVSHNKYFNSSNTRDLFLGF